ncbi:hypothetical protein [Fibrella arboris]|uniref:hypothetical protein n=1 Tax=Fibrella arboris TaxID=3242486 RepID=UPI0035211CCB
MYRLLNCLVLLALIGLSSCSMARPTLVRHGDIVTHKPRINWPQPEQDGQQQPGALTAGRHDGIYSVHHYKQGKPTVRRLADNEGIRVNYPRPGLAGLTSYKMPMPGAPVTGGITIEHRLAAGLTGSNYKMPMLIRPSEVNGQRPGLVPFSGKPVESLNRFSPTVTPDTSAPINPIN